MRRTFWFMRVDVSVELIFRRGSKIWNHVVLWPLQYRYVSTERYRRTHLISSWALRVVMTDAQKGGSMTYSGITITSSFLKTGQLLQILKSGNWHTHTHRQGGDLNTPTFFPFTPSLPPPPCFPLPHSFKQIKRKHAVSKVTVKPPLKQRCLHLQKCIATSKF